MSFIYAERLIEFAIRVGTDDMMKDQNLVDLMFYTDAHKNVGTDLTPPGEPAGSVREKLPYDFFQKRLSEIPKRKSEVGQTDIFENSIPQVPDIKEYLQTANIKIMHGYPRETKDLPCISIVLGSEDESQYLGVRKGVIQGTNKRYDLIGSDFQSQYNILIQTPNYDETIIWYHIIRYSLLRYRPHLEGYGMRQQSMSWMDAEPAPQFLEGGVFVYQRACVLSCVKDEDIPVEQSAYSEFGMGIQGYPQDTNGTVVPTPPGPPPEPVDPRSQGGG